MVRSMYKLSSKLGNRWARGIRFLRTVFFAEGLSEPLQVVLCHALPAWTEYDWRLLSQSEREARLATVLREDRTLGF